MPITEPRVLKGRALREKIRTVRGFGSRRILGQKPWPKQIEMETQVFEGKHARTEISGCVGSTKTYGLAMVALNWLMAYKPSRVFSLAPSFRQVNANLWGYMKKIWNDAKSNGTPIGDDGDILQIPRINLGCRPDCKVDHEHVADWYYEGFSTDEPHNVHGLHGENDLVIIDDAHGIRQALADEIENITAGGNTKLVLAYNKMVLHGPTYDATHIEKAHWNHVGIAYSDLVAARRAGYPLPGALGQDAVSRWLQKYGKNSNFFKIKVLNLHPSQENDTLIPLDWIELAFIRGEQGKVPNAGDLVLGGDVAGEGDDNNALVAGRGMMVGLPEEWHEPDTMVTVGRFVAKMKDEEAHESLKTQKSKAFLFMDSCGLGGPMVNRVAEQNNRVESHHPNCVGCTTPIKVMGLNGAERADGVVREGNKVRDAHEVFANLRSQMYWNLRERLNPANPPETLIGMTRGTTPEEIEISSNLAAQLSCIKWRTGSNGKKEVEPKIGVSLNKGGTANWGIKRRLGFSPDMADGTVYLVWGFDRIGAGKFQAPEATPAGAPASEGDKFRTAKAGDHGVFMDGVIAQGGLDGVE